MNRSCAALLLLLSSAVTASAQSPVVDRHAAKQQPGASVDDVVARMMRFDRNSDFKLAIDELPERMQILVVRGDRTDDLMLDIGEIRRLTGLRPQVLFPSDAQRVAIYGFGDAFGTLSSRTHIENSIDDLRLAPQTAAEAKRIAFAQADEFERSAQDGAGQRLTDERRANLIARLSGVLTEEESGDLNAALARRPLVKAADTFAVTLEQLKELTLQRAREGTTANPGDR